MPTAGLLPPEVWEIILDHLDTNSLLNLQSASRDFSDTVYGYVMAGRLVQRAMTCHRLSYKEAIGALHHRRAINNVVSVNPDASVAICGIGIYGGRDDEVLDESVHVTFDRTTNTVEILENGQSVLSQTKVTSTTKEARESIRKEIRELGDRRIPHTHTVWLKPPCRIEAGEVVDIRHNLTPTDVTNHYSGYPITVTGAELWTCCGVGGNFEVQCPGVTFRFGKSRVKGRCCFQEGQIPYIKYWKMQRK